MPNYDQYRIPKKAPLPCFGLEYQETDKDCQACPHQEGCRLRMGTRLTRHSLDKVHWNLIPKKLTLIRPYATANISQAALQGCFVDCFEMVFGRRPRPENSAERFRRAIQSNANSLNMDIRMYILSAMIGWKAVNAIHLDKNAEVESLNTVFPAKYLASKLAINSAMNYSEECRRQFGGFTATSLGLLNNEQFEQRGIQYRMLSSEVAAAKHIISYKLNCGGPAIESLYEDKEMELDSHWLAIEKTYHDAILVPHSQKAFGTKLRRDKRRDVNRVLAFLKTHKGEARYAFLMRQEIMPTALARVLHYFGYDADDFNAPKKPVTDTLAFWTQLGRAIVHYNCWLQINGASHSIYRDSQKL